MTKQEALFCDRMALHMTKDLTMSIEQAARLVCADDVRILNTYSRFSDEKQKAFKQAFIATVYQRLTQKEPR